MISLLDIVKTEELFQSINKLYKMKICGKRYEKCGKILANENCWENEIADEYYFSVDLSKIVLN